MSEYECGHEIFDYNKDGTYVKECRLCKPPAMTLQEQLAEQLAELEELNRSTYLPLPFYQMNKKLISFAIAVLEMPVQTVLYSSNGWPINDSATGYNAFREEVHQLVKELGVDVV